MHVNLLLGIPKPKYEPFITHKRGTSYDLKFQEIQQNFYLEKQRLLTES